MRLGCSCGAWIRARRKDALTWETRHTCPDRPDNPDHITAGAQVEHAGQWEGDRAHARIGFTKE